MFPKSFQIAPPREFIDCSVLVELLSFCISDDADRWNKFHVDLDSFTGKVHLLVRLWNVFRIWQLFRHLPLTAQNTIQSGDRTFIAISAQFYPKNDQSCIRIPSAEVCDLAQFSFCVLVRMVVRTA